LSAQQLLMPIKIFSCVNVFLIDLIIFNFANIKNYRMMKINYIHKVFSLFLFLLVASGCESSKKTAGNKDFMIEKITFEKSGMRGASKLEITKDKFSVEDSGRGV